MYYRAIFISDTHLGSRNSDITKLLLFLKESDSDFLYIVGDFIDGWELKRKWFWHKDYNLLIQKLLRKARKGTKIYLLIGNHDDFLFNLQGLEFSNIEIKREIIHNSSRNEKYMVIHGDQFDGIVKYAKWLQHIGSNLYNLIIDINTLSNRLIRFTGKNYSFAKFIKQNTKSALNFVNKFEDCVIEYAKSNKVSGIIAGHLHSPADKKIGSVHYLNCGSWQENEFHAVIEDSAGNFSLITL